MTATSLLTSRALSDDKLVTLEEIVYPVLLIVSFFSPVPTADVGREEKNCFWR
jgi:hypothetical protein